MNAMTTLSEEERDWEFQFHDEVVLENSPTIPGGATLKLHRTQGDTEFDRGGHPIASYVGEVEGAQVVLAMSPVRGSETEPLSGALMVHRPFDDKYELLAVGADPEKLMPEDILRYEYAKDQLPSGFFDLPGFSLKSLVATDRPDRDMADQVRDVVSDMAVLQIQTMNHARSLRDAFVELDRGDRQPDVPHHGR